MAVCNPELQPFCCVESLSYLAIVICKPKQGFGSLFWVCFEWPALRRCFARPVLYYQLRKEVIYSFTS